MADFASWVCGGEGRMPWDPGEFLDAYRGNRSAAREIGLDGIAIAIPLIAMIRLSRLDWVSIRSASSLHGPKTAFKTYPGVAI